jgi:hypothetical protein
MADIDIAAALARRAAQTGATVRYRVTDPSGASYLVTAEREYGQTKTAVLAEGRMQGVSPTGSGSVCGCCGGTGQSR